MNATFVISSPDVAQCPASRLPEYAFIGRSNVGKSSLINMLCRDPHLAKTSQKPGKTLLINHFLVEGDACSPSSDSNGKWHLVDLPGYGYARASKTAQQAWSVLIDDYLHTTQSLAGICQLLHADDIRFGLPQHFVNCLNAAFETAVTVIVQYVCQHIHAHEFIYAHDLLSNGTG